MIVVDGNGRDRVEEKIFPNLFSFFSLLLISLFFLLFLLHFIPSFLFYYSFYFFKDTSKFHKNLHEIRMWKSFWF